MLLKSSLVAAVLAAAVSVAPKHQDGLDPLAFQSASDSHRFQQQEQETGGPKSGGKGKLPSWLEKPPYWLPTPPEWGPPPQHLFTTWYNPQTIPQPVFKPSPFSQAGTAYQAATAPYGAPGLPVAGSGFSYAGAGAGSVPPAVAPIGQAILLETGSGALAGRNSADALLSDANAVAAVVGAAARAEVPDAAAAAGMEAHRLARVLALHESLVMAHRLEATAKYASALHDASSGASSSPAVASAASTAHRNVAAGIMSDLLAESEHSAGR